VQAEEGSEALLEGRALGAGGVFLQAVEGELALAGAAFARVASDQVRQREAVGELEGSDSRRRFSTVSASSVAARSRIVRGTVVTGMPSSTVTSSTGKGE